METTLGKKNLFHVLFIYNFRNYLSRSHGLQHTCGLDRGIKEQGGKTLSRCLPVPCEALEESWPSVGVGTGRGRAELPLEKKKGESAGGTKF